jgi:hypothetical protein
MPALQEEFSGGEGLTFEGLMQKLSAVWGAIEAAITNAGGQLAEKICEFMMQDSAEGTMGDSVGWLAGTIVFEVVLAILTAGTANAARGGMKVLQVVLKVLDWTGEALGLAFKGLAKLGGFVIDIVKGIGKLLSNTGGAAKSVLGALGEIGETLMRYADELLGKVGKGAAGETAEEGVEKTGKRSSREAADEVAERQQALLIAKGIAKVNEEAGTPPNLLINQLMPLAGRYRSVNSFHAIPISVGHSRIIMRAKEENVDPDYSPENLTATVKQDADKIIENEGKNQRRRQAATSRAGLPEVGMSQPFQNIYYKRPSSFPGFEVVGKNGTEDILRVSNVDSFMDELGLQYSNSGFPLHPRLEEIIRNVISDPSRTFNSTRGVPGLHAEVRAVNDILHSLEKRGIPLTDDTLSKIDVATFQVHPIEEVGEQFPACTNCTNILNNVVNILTGVTP